VFENLISALHLLLSVAGLFALEPGALGLAVAVLAAVVVLAVVLAVAAPACAARSGPHPRRAIDRSAPLSQSDPDAAGHPRPRAPGFAASAAY
jgi:hypothetical protein